MFVGDPAFAPKEFARILNGRLAADTAKLAAVLPERLTMFPDVFGPLILQRNREWAPVAERSIAESTPTVFVMSSLHTVGTGSFIELFGGFWHAPYSYLLTEDRDKHLDMLNYSATGRNAPPQSNRKF